MNDNFSAELFAFIEEFGPEVGCHIDMGWHGSRSCVLVWRQDDAKQEQDYMMIRSSVDMDVDEVDVIYQGDDIYTGPAQQGFRILWEHLEVY